MDFQNNTTQIILAIIALFAIGFVIKISTKKKSTTLSNSHSLKKVKTDGDIVFGDKKTKIKK